MLQLVRKLFKGGDVDRARKYHARSERLDDQARRLFLRALNADEGGGRILLGRAMDLEGQGQWVGLPRKRLLSLFALITGATGAGKSRLIAAMLYGLLRQKTTTIVVDMKSELSEILLDVLVPGLAAMGVDVGPIRRVQPFEPGLVPMLRLTEPEAGVSREVQAMNLASNLAEGIGSSIGLRMHRMLLKMSMLAIERNQPFPIIREWAGNPNRFAADARTSEDITVREYALRDFPRENRASLDALRSRLDSLFHLHEVRLALSAPKCLSFSECLESGLTIFDFGSPPAGAEDAAHFLAGPVIGRITRAVLSRQITNESQPVLLVWEEFQEALRKHQIQQFKRALSLSRFKLACHWFSNQAPGQIADADPHLLRSLRTNTGIEMIFRSSIEDATRLASSFASRRSDETMAKAKARFIEEIASLPRREYFLWIKDRPFGPQRVRSPRFELEPLIEKASSLDAETRLRIQRGSVVVPVGDVREIAPEYTDADTPVLKSRKVTKGLG